MIRLLIVALFSAALAAVELPPERMACHGQLDGQPFWMRLEPVDARFGGNRLWQVVWTPPTPDTLAGAHVGDVPFILLDPAGLTVGHNSRSTLGRILPTASGAYRVVREIHIGSGDQAQPTEEVRIVPGPRAWDLRLAPLHLAWAWRAESSGEARVADFFGPRFREELTIRWNGTRVELAGTVLTARAGTDGRLAALDGPGVALVIQGWAVRP